MEQYIITKKQAKEHGVNLDNVSRCRQIRKLAQLDRVKLDDSSHSDNIYNKHLFSYIEYCGLDVKDYIKGYLSNLQPFMIEHLGEQEKNEAFICVLDNAYRVSIYIKLDKTKGEEIIVSFHENVRRGIVKENNMKRDTVRLAGQIVPVFAEPTGARVEGSPREQVKVFMQRGMLVLPVLVMAQACEDGIYLVERGQLEQPIVDACNQYLRDLYTSNIKLDALDNVELFSVLQQMSFTSYGNTIFSNISLLIDNLEIQKGVPSKKAADFALITYLDNLYLTDLQAKELIDVLSERYKLSPSKGLENILERVIDEITATADNTMKIIDAEEKDHSDPASIADNHNANYVPVDDSGINNLSNRRPGR